jgi:hypothetical protein
MAHDVSQWLSEIRTLQHQVNDLRQERDQAYASAANWRRLYEAEAAQRRQQAEQAELRIKSLLQEIEAYRGQPIAEGEMDTMLKTVNEIQSVEELQSQLIEALKLCDHLSRTLTAEQANHEQTRQSLTTALGDAVDLLTKEREETTPASLGAEDTGPRG